MNVIWKRPDGFHGATPADFHVVAVGSDANLWLHNEDKDTFPFRISGGWEEEEQTKRLNNLINLLSKPHDDWIRHLEFSFEHSMKDDRKTFITDLASWLAELKPELKGDKWEIDIMSQVVSAVEAKISANKDQFLAE